MNRIRRRIKTILYDFEEASDRDEKDIERRTISLIVCVCMRATIGNFKREKKKKKKRNLLENLIVSRIRHDRNNTVDKVGKKEGTEEGKVEIRTPSHALVTKSLR